MFNIMIDGKARIMNIFFDPNTGCEAYDFSTAADFKSVYSNQKVIANGKRQTVADVWLAHPERRVATGLCGQPQSLTSKPRIFFKAVDIDAMFRANAKNPRWRAASASPCCGAIWICVFGFDSASLVTRFC